MNDRDDCREIARHHEVDAVGELSDQRTLHGISDERELAGILGDSLEHNVELVEQALT